MGKDFIKGTGAEAETAPVVEDREFDAEETKNQLRLNEDDFISGLLEASDFSKDEAKTIEVIRTVNDKRKKFFEFKIRPLTADEYDTCRKRSSKFVRNKQLGIKMVEDTDSVKYRALIIYTATVEEDKEKLWNNKKIWDGLEKKGKVVVTGSDVVDFCLKAGEKDRIVEAIDVLSGFENNNLEEVAKN